MNVNPRLVVLRAHPEYHLARAAETEPDLATALNAMVSKMVRQAFWRRGFSEPALVSQWPSIVGVALAGKTAPLKIVFPRKERMRGILHIRVAGAFAVELQHIAPLIVERLNAYYGYPALAGLALHQAPVEDPAAAAPAFRHPERPIRAESDARTRR